MYRSRGAELHLNLSSVEMFPSRFQSDRPYPPPAHRNRKNSRLRNLGESKADAAEIGWSARLVAGGPGISLICPLQI